jgi:hypothetical protein
MICLSRERARAKVGTARGKHGRRGIPFLVRVLEEARRHNTFPIDEEGARVRNPV